VNGSSSNRRAVPPSRPCASGPCGRRTKSTSPCRQRRGPGRSNRVGPAPGSANAVVYPHTERPRAETCGSMRSRAPMRSRSRKQSMADGSSPRKRWKLPRPGEMRVARTARRGRRLPSLLRSRHLIETLGSATNPKRVDGPAVSDEPRADLSVPATNCPLRGWPAGMPRSCSRMASRTSSHGRPQSGSSSSSIAMPFA
jgi:hypothetical protein